MNRRKIGTILGLLWLSLSIGHTSVAVAKERWVTLRYVRMAQDALALGLMEKWREALELGDAAFAREAPQMPLYARTNAKLWLHLLWSKYYQYAGILPPIKDVSSFEDQKALSQFIDQFAKAVSFLKQALYHLNRYNALYTQAIDRANLRSQVYLQASLSLARDLEERIRSGRIYIAFLRYAHSNWTDKAKIKKNLEQNQLAVLKLQESQKKAHRERGSLRKEQKKLATLVNTVRQDYSRMETKILGREQTFRILLSIGIAVSAAALGVGIYSTYTYISVDSRPFCPPNEPGPNCNTNAQTKGQAFLSGDLGTMSWLMVASSGTLLIGLSLIIASIAIRPPQKSGDRAVLRSHNKYLDHERKKQETQSQIWRGKVPWANAALPPSTGALVLGRW